MKEVTEYKVKRINAEEVSLGMTLAESVTNVKGNILMPAGYVVEDKDRVRSFLEQHKIKTLAVKVPVIKEVPREEKEKKGTAAPKNAPRRVTYEPRYAQDLSQYKTHVSRQKKALQRDFDRILKGAEIASLNLEKSIERVIKNAQKRQSNPFQLIESSKELDDMVYNHCHNVVLISYYLGKWLDLSKKRLNELTLTAALHDIGKLKVDPEFLEAEEMTEEEALELKKHAIYSHAIVKEDSYVDEQIKRAILLHHENVDGSGFPFGLKREKIPLYSRIIAIADTYNDLTSKRPFNAKKNPLEALKHLETELIDKLDVELLLVFLNKLSSCFIGQKVGLNTGEVGEIVFVPKQYSWRPMVKLEKNDQVLDLRDPDNEALQIEIFY
ncbi:HD-GYP domain-containing protein [Isachenkonia alkalipeptolytica]|uniref:HD domain-containing protein n=1 Tax=Isachenkonia alkalipeptolytica TaxID=2565777 RepID=A0AA43XMJ5_9CLOT|nr:HD domain-containing phosphohydrolase [Isachenkonia alkalipeptolytica]NBG89074.1 HD domain-containing protein [Isachenkonia alkalipeptolytica]